MDVEDDVVITNWGEPWRLPTEADAMELYNNCTWSLGVLNGIGGCYVTGPNGNSLFIPKAGYKQYKTTFKRGSEFYLLLSTLYKNNEVQPNYGLLIYCDDSSYGLGGEERSFGFSARAVTNPNYSSINDLRSNNHDRTQFVFDLQGNRLLNVKKGLNIIRSGNGQMRKVFVK